MHDDCAVALPKLPTGHERQNDGCHAPTTSLYVDTGHGKQCVLLEYVPRGHGTQSSPEPDASADTVPDGQMWQPVDPVTLLNVPRAHAKHTDAVVAPIAVLK